MRFIFLILLILPAMDSAAHRAERPDTLRLAELREAASHRDPRSVHPDLIERATRLRMAALRSQRLPQLAVTGQATVQNEVPQIPIDLPLGSGGHGPPLEQYRAQLEVDWTLYDGGRVGRQVAGERARQAEEQAGVAAALYAVREATTEAFFSALLFDAQMQTLSLAAEDLEARLRVARVQSDEGAALAAEAAALEAEHIRVRQQVDEAAAARRAAMSVLADLTGLDVRASDILLPPDLDGDVAEALDALDHQLRNSSPPGPGVVAVPFGRPELLRLARRADRAEAEARIREAQVRPSLSLFGQAGVGRPSPFNFFSDELSEYGLAGIRLRWSPFDWGRTRREAEAIRVQAHQADTDAAAFVHQIAREIEDERANLMRLNAALADDERAVALREEVLRVTRRQLDEGALLPDTYTGRLSDLAEARLARERHRIERARAEARILSTLGRFPESRLLPPGTVRVNENVQP